MTGKSIKAATLQELLDWITSQRNVITEAVYPEVVVMVSSTVLLFHRHITLIRPSPSSHQICSDRSLHRSTPREMRMIQKRMNQCWNSLGLIYKSFTSSFYDLWSVLISIRTLPNDSLTNNSSYKFVFHFASPRFDPFHAPVSFTATRYELT